MLQRVARDEHIPLVQVNMVGANDELIFDGHSVALNAQGEVLALGASFAEEVLVVDVGGSTTGVPAVPTLTLPVNQEEQLFHALVLGVRDYVHKCAFKSVVLGLIRRYRLGARGRDRRRSARSGAGLGCVAPLPLFERRQPERRGATGEEARHSLRRLLPISPNRWWKSRNLFG